MNKLGIMQGRLTNPKKRENIQFPLYNSVEIINEFDSAKYLELDYIEWTICKGISNLFMGDFYCQEILKGLKNSSKVSIDSICLDYLMDLDLNNKDLTFATDTINWIANIAETIDCKTIIIPIYQKNMEMLPIRYLISQILERYHIKIAFEFLNSNSFTGINFINDLCYPDKLSFRGENNKLGCCFDIGNNCYYIVSESDKFRLRTVKELIKEMENYNKYKLLYHIHIKEKDKHGNTVPLGKGIIGKKGWKEIFSFLKDINYSGDYTLQVARGENGDEMNHIHNQIAFVKGLM